LIRVLFLQETWIMGPTHPRTPRIARRGWTPKRRRQFLDLLAAGAHVRRACARVGLSREGAYRLRQRDAGFARAWNGARRSARPAADEAFIALLPEKLRRTLSELSGQCELRTAGISPLDRVPSVPSV
jgi:hypothetical protein